MESRACYGWYGEGCGASGESAPIQRGGYKMSDYYFLVDWHDSFFSNKVSVKAMDFAHAEKNVKAWAKKDGGTFIGEDPDYYNINHYYDKDRRQ